MRFVGKLFFQLCPQSVAAADLWEEQRPVLADITNIQPLQLGTPPRRSESALAAAAASSNPCQLPSFLFPERSTFSPLSPLERNAIAVLAADHQPPDIIAAKVQTTVNTVRKWRDVFEDGDDGEGEYRPGRKPKLSSEEMERIVDVAIEESKQTPREIRHLLDLDCSDRTVRRVLDEAGLFGRITRVAPPLKPEHIRKRLSYAEGYGNWTPQQWNSVLWSDEMSIAVGPQGEHWCQRLINDEWNPDNVMEKEKHPDKVHVWGCFSGEYGVGEIHVFDENLDAELMKEILNKHLLQSARPFLSQSPPAHWWFQQDNDPKHTSKPVKKWIAMKGIDCLEWPPYSPDLNPIENLWAKLKKRVETENATNKKELTEAVIKQWSKIEDSFCSKLVASIPHRLDCVVRNAGAMTGY
jgi:transposase